MKTVQLFIPFTDTSSGRSIISDLKNSYIKTFNDLYCKDTYFL